VAVSFYINLIQIIISIALIAIILLQAKGSGLGGIFGGDSSIYKTRRGVEKTLFQATIGLAVAFFAVSILSVLLTGQ
jgi:preprotein translocase subunit SecG